jgi:hypothetical protein
MIVSYLLSSGSLAAASLAQLVTFAILARALGPAEFGLFVQISAVTAIAVQICGLGASDCLLRRVAREPASYPDLLGHNPQQHNYDDATMLATQFSESHILSDELIVHAHPRI